MRTHFLTVSIIIKRVENPARNMSYPEVTTRDECVIRESMSFARKK